MHGVLADEVAEIVALTTSGARWTAPTASWPTGAPTWVGCECRRPRCGASCLLRASICTLHPVLLRRVAHGFVSRANFEARGILACGPVRSTPPPGTAALAP